MPFGSLSTTITESNGFMYTHTQTEESFLCLQFLKFIDIQLFFSLGKNEDEVEKKDKITRFPFNRENKRESTTKFILYISIGFLDGEFAINTFHK